jgi:hypothetical protein
MPISSIGRAGPPVRATCVVFDDAGFLGEFARGVFNFLDAVV